MRTARNIAPLIATLLLCATARAYDFAAVMPSGQTLYFNIVNGEAVVTYPNANAIPTQGWGSYTRPTGALTIPATVSDGTNTYAVAAISGHALYGCSQLTSVTVADGVRSIRSYAFAICNAVTDITLPASIDSIGANAFRECTSLATLTTYRPQPPVTAASAFSQVDLSAVTLNVTCNALQAYGQSTPWSQFGTVADIGCTATLTATANHADRGSVSGGGNYPVGTAVVLHATPADGFFFACWGDGDSTNPRVVGLDADLALTAFFFALRRDTVTISSVQHDTVYTTTVVRDTVVVTVHDTVPTGGPSPTFFTLTATSSDAARGVAAGSCTVPAGTVIELAAIPYEGNRFVRWNDWMTDNPRRVQLTSNQTYTAIFEPATTGVATAEGAAWTVHANGRTLVVGGAGGQRLRILDMQGRTVAEMAAAQATTTIALPCAGSYLVQVGDSPARKIVASD